MKYYVVDAFAEEPFRGNPAGVCVVGEPISAELMQRIAYENNLSETAFVTPRGDAYDLRWFTPSLEIDLCGHATLGTAYVVSNFVQPGAERMGFNTRSGRLEVTRRGEFFFLDFPSRLPQPVDAPAALAAALGLDGSADLDGVDRAPMEAYAQRDLLVVMQSEREVRALEPNYSVMAQMSDYMGVIVTAPADSPGVDFVSRFFAPRAGVNEDPVTGSSHTELIPFWARRLGKATLVAEQVSRRGGTLWCENAGARVIIGGKATLYMIGEILPAGGLPAHDGGRVAHA